MYKINEEISKKAFHYMSQSRPGWNIPHLHSAIKHMKLLLKEEGGNEKILLTTIYLHDIGYAGKNNKKNYTFEDSEAPKNEHMQIGAIMANDILSQYPDEYSNEEIVEICYLISIHDNFDKIIGHNAQLVFEADTFGQIDVDDVKPNFTKEEFLKWFEMFNEKRAPLIKTRTGIRLLKIYVQKLKDFYKI